MIREILKTIFILLVLMLYNLQGNVVSAQAMYLMSNNYVTDCEGILTDSDDGPEEGQYDHNEDYTFTICVDQANEIILSFDFFATEDRYDVLTIYDGPDTNSPVLATLSGVVQPPPVLIARSGCVTLHFVSDDNIVANGWSMNWRVEIDEPEVPDLIVDGTTECPFQNGRFKFSLPIDCDLFTAGNFSVVGPGNPSIANINLLDCDPGTNLGSTFEIIFNDSLRTQGTYRIEFMGAVQDVCGEWHDISASVIFMLENCPILIEATVVDTACVGDCGRVRVDLIGDTPDNYTFRWSHTSDNGQEVDACFDDTTTITVDVVNLSTSRRTTTQVVYYPYPEPEFLNPLSRDTFCSSRGDHIYDVSVPGGEFYSQIIPNNQRTSGRYQFWRWNNQTNLNQDIVEYIDPHGCRTYDTLYILPINAGSIQAACEGSGTFTLNGGSPSGGQWEGPHVSPSGIFDPTTSGSFIVTYVAPNGCRANKRVNVLDSIEMPDIDTLCSSRRIDLRDFTNPYGGRWSGPGITNTTLGRLEGWRPTSNQTYRYYYDLNGCRDSIDIYIQQLYSGPDRDICTSIDTLFLNYTGTWTGPGVYLPGLNAFDVSMLGEGDYTYTLEKDGCTDEFDLHIITPYAEVNEAMEFCLEDAWYSVLDFVNIFPDYGTFTGPNILDSIDLWFFNPSRLGPGLHPIYFEAAGCMDTIWVDVELPAEIPPYQFCEFDDATELQANPPGGIWTGTGVLDGQSGLFDPQIPGIGFHEITYTTPRGCVTVDTIEIFAFEEVSIDGIDQQYCFSDTTINIILQPGGGQLYINGMLTSNTQFNPSQLGPGNHELFYTKGGGECKSDDRLFFSVLSPITGQINTPDDSICIGDPTTVAVTTTGGIGNRTATWDQNLGFGESHIIRPTESAWYNVLVVDGCSIPFEDSVFVYVYPEFEVQLDEGPEVCYGDSTWVQILPPNTNDYTASFDNGDDIPNFIINGNPGNYSVRVEDIFSGCFQNLDVVLPGANPLQANFSINPNQPCIDIINNEISIIDLATGYTDGWITFGDGTADTISLLDGIFEHEYTEIGDFKITQFVINELGCTDTLSRWICVENKVQYFIPNVFTPNGDDDNDVFKIFVLGADNLDWRIFNRFGGTVFQSNSIDEGWDGTYKGQKLDPAVFVVKVSFTDAETGIPYVFAKSITLLK